MTMGTASTMTVITDDMGLTLPGTSSVPAVDSGHQRMAADCGRRIVGMVWEDLTPGRIVTAAAVRNAAIVAMARRAGVDLTLDDLDALDRETPLIANVRPSGKDYLIEDFFYAGGLRALMTQIADRLDLSTLTVIGKTMGKKLEGAVVHNDNVIRPLSNPVYHEGSLAVLRGNLCPDGAIIKPAACDPKYHVHQGPALVFDSYPDMKAAVDDENLDVTPDTVMVLRNAGPLGGPGFPEWGMLPIPKALIKQGHRDMLRISDARMSCTSYGACVLHVAPKAYIGGPLALLKTGDLVRLDLPARRLDMLVPKDEISARRAATGAHGWMFSQHVTQADKGCDFDFLERGFGPSAGEPEIF